MDDVAIIGIDLAKNVFQVHGATSTGASIRIPPDDLEQIAAPAVEDEHDQGAGGGDADCGGIGRSGRMTIWKRD